MALSSEDVACLLMASERSVAFKVKPIRRVSVHSVNKLRGIFGEYHHLFPQLRCDSERFFEYCRMDCTTFDYILEKIKHRTLKNWCNLHKQKILPEERLVVTLR